MGVLELIVNDIFRILKLKDKFFFTSFRVIWVLGICDHSTKQLLDLIFFLIFRIFQWALISL